jgi:pimeloyl-ACP methyl ester carboxylesterase
MDELIAEPRLERIPTDGVELSVRRWDGEGTAFLLVHGLASCARLWDGVAAELAAAGHRVVAVDLRGHGESDKPEHGYGFDEVTGDLVALIDRMALDRPVVAGQSWGGNVVLELAARQPGRLRGVACVDGGTIELAARFPEWEDCRAALAPPDVDGVAVAQLEAWFRTNHPDWPETGIQGALACFEVLPDGTARRRLTIDRHLEVLRGLWEHRPGDRYAAVEVPVLLVPAEGGAAVPESIERAGATLPRSRTVWMAGDHDLHAQHPAEVAALLRSCLDDGFFPA